ncbi:hypothetical protein RJ53_05885 [Methanocalculus chunghsingensis]|uniref:histidine kinase n=1 Tax=Methanocalculus chunghsingensis TaxID=156457 RepID=A0A8J8B483_9EURY|nr:PAS domain S-box protein [Methanocalculus chunghsingensis]MBR1369055.1 hypothetical protein [Methanocalculus chunghsingensis]
MQRRDKDTQSLLFLRYGGQNNSDLWIVTIGLTSILSILATILLLDMGQTDVYPHLFYIPIILAAYRYRQDGVIYGTLLAGAYLLLHGLILPEPSALIDALFRSFVMAGVGGIVGLLSGRLSESEERYRKFAENAEDIIYRIDLVPEQRFAYVNPAVTRITGYTPEEHYENPILGFRIVHPADRHLLNNIQDGERVNEPIILRWIRKDGSVIWVEQQNTPIYNKEGTLIAIEGIGRDITRRKKADETRRLLASIVTYSDDAILSLSTDAKVLSWNKGAEEIFGWTAEEMIGTDYQRVIPPEDRAIFRSYFFEMVARKIPQRRQINRLHRSGKKIRLALSIAPVLDENGAIIAISGIMRDITDQIRMEEVLRRSEELYRALFYGTSIPTALLEADGTIALVNDGFSRLTGDDPDMLKGRLFPLIFPESRREEIAAILSSCSVGDDRAIREIGASIIRRDGEERTLIGRFAPLSESRQVIISAIDITEQQKMIQRLSEGLEEKEILLKEVHHRVKNNMQVVSSLLHLQALTLREDQYAEIFRESENRITSMALVHETLYRSETLSRIDLRDYIGRLAEEVVQSYGSPGGISLTCRIEDISLDIDTAISCGLIINELLSNALKHAFVGRNKGEVVLSFQKGDNGCLSLTLEDDGIGLPMDFHPGDNARLGIELVRRLARQIGGRLAWSGCEGGGTIWTVRFPQEEEMP